jgi:hypothetical protein
MLSILQFPFRLVFLFSFRLDIFFPTIRLPLALAVARRITIYFIFVRLGRFLSSQAGLVHVRHLRSDQSIKRT